MNYHAYPILYEKFSSKVYYLIYNGRKYVRYLGNNIKHGEIIKKFENCIDGILFSSIPKARLSVVYTYFDSSKKFRFEYDIDESDIKKIEYENKTWFLWQSDAFFVNMGCPYMNISFNFEIPIDENIEMIPILGFAAQEIARKLPTIW